MPMTASIVGNDPLARFLRDHVADKHPIPLTATRIDVKIRGGLAIVTTERTFRNSEQQSIEATMTFPVPVDATLCALTARIDGRVLNAVAQARAKARETYETAVEQGKAAALHEELLKGIHMLSVAHVRPGAEIVVTDTWTAPLSFVAGEPRLRIPVTVGEIYGRSPLAPSDDLVTGPHVHEASIAVRCDNGTASLLRAGPASDGRHTITLDAPIDIVVSSWSARQLAGVAADGRRVTLDIEPAPASEDSLDIDLLFDRSGSMTEWAVGDPEVRGTKFEVAKAGLSAAVRDRFGSADRLRLWEFNDTVRHVGEASGLDCRRLVETLSGPDGGTEIGRAFDAVIATGKARNVVILTDGKSYAFAPHTLARTGIRVTAVLIGDDALEAGIAHLAGMTGGQLFVADGSDAGTAVAAAIAAARAPCVQPEPIEGALSHVVALRRGARIVATWSDQTWSDQTWSDQTWSDQTWSDQTWSDQNPGEQSTEAARIEARQVGAAAAMLAIPLMREDAASALAEAEGVVCHLTSLVLVDEAGERQAGLPASRKVALSAPSTGIHAMALRAAPAFADFGDIASAPPLSSASRSAGFAGFGGAKSVFSFKRRHAPAESEDIGPAAAPPRPRPTGAGAGAGTGAGSISLRGVARRIDWDDDPETLRRGHLSDLPPEVEAAIRAAALMPAVVALAQALGQDPIVVVIALIARAEGGWSRSAKRLARMILGKADAAAVETALREAGL